MGKLESDLTPRSTSERLTNEGCADLSNGNKAVTTSESIAASSSPSAIADSVSTRSSSASRPEINNGEVAIKELVVIGAGPHALTLLLRLLEADADLWSDKERHARANHAKKLRPPADVRRHVQNLL